MSDEIGKQNVGFLMTQLKKPQMPPKDAGKVAKSADTDQTDPSGAVSSLSSLCTQVCLSKNLGK